MSETEVERLTRELAEAREQLGGERLLHSLIEHRDREARGKAPRWEEDPVAIKHGWVTIDRCRKCGERNPQWVVAPAAPAADRTTTEEETP